MDSLSNIVLSPISEKIESKIPFVLVPTSTHGGIKVVEREFLQIQQGEIVIPEKQNNEKKDDKKKNASGQQQHNTNQNASRALIQNVPAKNQRLINQPKVQQKGVKINANKAQEIKSESSIENAQNKENASDASISSTFSFLESSSEYQPSNEEPLWTSYQHKLNQIYFGNASEMLMNVTLENTLLNYKANMDQEVNSMSQNLFQKNYSMNLPPRSVNLIQEFYIPTLGTTNSNLKIICKKNPFTGKIEHIYEKNLETKSTQDETNLSMSLERIPSLQTDFVRGSTEQLPFLPGGFDIGTNNKSIATKKSNSSSNQYPGYQEVDQMFSRRELLTVPPGFSSSGILSNETDQYLFMTTGKNSSDLIENLISEDKEFVKNQETSVKRNAIRLDSLFGEKDTDFEFDIESESESEEEISEVIPQKSHKDKSSNLIENESQNKADVLLSEIDHSLDDLLSDFDPKALLNKRNKKDKEKKWAIVDNTDVSNFKELVPKMAIEYPFDLDVFQKRAVYHLENGDSVFVAAHTSAGKTVVAEYAIALSQKHLTRVIYTSPIKTLSNQKFREFKKTFGDVGILTGDVQINPTATCLIMTTEILRSMLYRGADIIRDVEWVVFDEVHYLNDPDRGVVWEEVIIMLPKHVNLILLSATIPNTKEFAEWIGRTKQKTIYVMQTLHRPVPLEHHIHYHGNIYKIVDSNKEFLHQNYRNCLQDKKESDALAIKSQKKIKTGHSKMITEKSDFQKLIESLQKKNLLPVVVFSFSRKKCESLGYGMTTVDLTTSVEKSQIHVFVNESISRLIGTDRQLPQVYRISELVTRGIGVHHSGMLPIVKEMVEMLFAKGLVKVLFATETFAMGVNFPTKSVVFNGIRKHDGSEFRDLLSSEYIQMSGRAGRRGLDTAGIVIIHCNDDIVEETTLNRMILGKSTKLQSQFKLSYNMMLNLLRIEDFKVEDMLKRSFSETHNQKYMPDKIELEKNQQKIQDIEDIDCLFGVPDIDNYFSNAQTLLQASDVLLKSLLNESSNLLSGGRVITVKTNPYGTVLGVILKTTSAQSDDRLSIFFQDTTEILYVVLVIRQKNKSIAVYPNESLLPPFSSSNLVGENEPLTDIVVISKKKILTITKEKWNISNLKFDFSHNQKYIETKDLRSIGEKLLQLWQKTQDGPTCYNPSTDFKQNSIEVVEALNSRQKAIESMKQSKCFSCPKLEEQYLRKQKKYEVNQKLDTLVYALSDDNLELMPEFNIRLNILNQLNYIDDRKTLLLKGKVACEINSCNELIVTEMIFESHFTNLSPAECVSILSCLICEQKDEDAPNLTDRLETAKENLISLVDNLAAVQQTFGLPVSNLTAQECLRFTMMEVAYEWANGVPFKEICKLTTIQEGNIVRYITQIAHACREVRNAARVIGDSQLYQKMEDASTLIKRDVIFAASLWIS